MRILARLLALAIVLAPALAWGQSAVTLKDTTNAPVGTSGNPLYTTGTGGGGSGAVTAASGAFVNGSIVGLGNTTDVACAAYNTAACTANQLSRLIAETLANAATAANQNSTAAGTSAPNAGAIQGATGGVPVATSGITPGVISTGLVAVTGTHNAGSSVAGLQAIAAARGTGLAGWINQFTINSTTAGTNQLLVRLYKSTPAGGAYACTDGSAFVDTAAARALLITQPFSITMAAPANTTGDATAYGTNQGVWWPFVTSGNANVYACVVAVANDTTDVGSTIMFSVAALQY
jgi:hypothetical protein